MKNIAAILKENFDTIILEMYLKNEMCPQEISEKLLLKTGIKITSRSVQRKIKELGLNRSKSEAFNLSIKRGRKDYSHLKKPIKSCELRRGVSLKLRYQVLKRDNSKCVMCGSLAKDEILVIDHITPVVMGGKSNLENLQTLCRQCNHGKMLTEERHK